MTKTISTPIAKEELPEAVLHLAFEIQHFRVFNEDAFVKTLQNNGQSQAVGYAQLLHFRVLLDFFYPYEPQPDDCTVRTFIKLVPEFSAAFPKDVRKQPPWFRDVKSTLNKLLAHMTAKRWREIRPDWSYYRGPMKQLNDVTIAFHTALPEPLRSIFERRMSELERQTFAPRLS